jgi:hypothetical protein
MPDWRSEDQKSKLYVLLFCGSSETVAPRLSCSVLFFLLNIRPWIFAVFACSSRSRDNQQDGTLIGCTWFDASPHSVPEPRAFIIGIFVKLTKIPSDCFAPSSEARRTSIIRKKQKEVHVPRLRIEYGTVCPDAFGVFGACEWVSPAPAPPGLRSTCFNHY